MAGRYIRTKTKIVDLNNCFEEERLNGCPYVDKNTHMCIYKESVIASSDNVLDLCDEVVFIGKEDGKKHFAYKDCIGQPGWYEEYQLYGCIWTKWGLKFVVKIKDNKIEVIK